MKHVSNLILSGTVLVGALLAACGGDNPGNRDLDRLPIIDTLPPPGGLATPQLLEQMQAYAATLNGLRWPLPSAQHLSPPHYKLVLRNDGYGTYALICSERQSGVLCATVDAPLPPHTTVSDWSDNGALALGYKPTPGTGLDNSAVLAFEAAASGALDALASYGAPTLRNLTTPVEETPCEQVDETCNSGSDGDRPGRDNGGGIPTIPVTGSPDTGGWGGDGGYAPAPDPGTETPTATPTTENVIVIHGSRPPPVGAIAMFAGPPTALQVEQLASAEPKIRCVEGGIARVCIIGKRPPDELPGPVYWWPQTMCDWSHVFCSAGQEKDVRDDERIPGSEVCGKTLGELYTICDNQDAAFITQCNLNFRLKVLDYRGFLACTQRSTNKLAACRSTARRLTNNGEHPAKC